MQYEKKQYKYIYFVIPILHCVPKKCDHIFDDKLN